MGQYCKDLRDWFARHSSFEQYTFSHSLLLYEIVSWQFWDHFQFFWEQRSSCLSNKNRLRIFVWFAFECFELSFIWVTYCLLECLVRFLCDKSRHLNFWNQTVMESDLYVIKRFSWFWRTYWPMQAYWGNRIEIFRFPYCLMMLLLVYRPRGSRFWIPFGKITGLWIFII